MKGEEEEEMGREEFEVENQRTIQNPKKKILWFANFYRRKSEGALGQAGGQAEEDEREEEAHSCRP